MCKKPSTSYTSLFTLITTFSLCFILCKGKFWNNTLVLISFNKYLRKLSIKDNLKVAKNIYQKCWQIVENTYKKLNINYQKHLLKHLFGNICQSLKSSFRTHLLKLTTTYNNSLFFQLLTSPYAICSSILKTCYKVTRTQYYYG